MPISFINQDIKFQLPDKRKIIAFIKFLITDFKKKQGNICFIFTSDKYLLNINRQYLSHDYYTDIITFDYCENNLISGDIMISIDRVKENATEFNSGFEEELRRVMIHGVLHLLGLKDDNSENKQKMRETETKYLNIYSQITQNTNE